MPIFLKDDPLYCSLCGRDLPKPQSEVFRSGWVVCVDCGDDVELQELLKRKATMDEGQLLMEQLKFFLKRGRARGAEREGQTGTGSEN